MFKILAFCGFWVLSNYFIYKGVNKYISDEYLLEGDIPLMCWVGILTFVSSCCIFDYFDFFGKSKLISINKDLDV